MTDYSELKGLAEAAMPFDYEFDWMTKEVCKYRRAANPTVVLALIADLENAHRATNSECRDWAREYELRKLAQKERDQLKAENEALQLALESCADELEGQVIQRYHGIPVADMHPVTRRAYDRDMTCVVEARAAMGKGEQA